VDLDGLEGAASEGGSNAAIGENVPRPPVIGVGIEDDNRLGFFGTACHGCWAEAQPAQQHERDTYRH